MYRLCFCFFLDSFDHSGFLCTFVETSIKQQRNRNVIMEDNNSILDALPTLL